MCLGLVVLVGGIIGVLWRGRVVGLAIKDVVAPTLRASLVSKLSGANAKGVVVVNWPREIAADQSANLMGIIPVVPPTYSVDLPEGLSDSATWLQFRPWQANPPGLKVEYAGKEMLPEELASQVKGADRVFSFDTQTSQMIVLLQRLPAATLNCPSLFDDVCLQQAQVQRNDREMQLTLDWQVNDTVPAETTVFVHILTNDGMLIAQADGDPVGNLLALSNWPGPGASLRETRRLPVPDGDYQISIGVYNRVSGERWSLRCTGMVTCDADAVVISPGH